jgi:branched-chain amino acid transport system ATP-binding protein
LGITTVVQGRGIFPKLTVWENLEMGLSSGEQQMLAIWRGIMADPLIMLLDEPSDGIMPGLTSGGLAQ